MKQSLICRTIFQSAEEYIDLHNRNKGFKMYASTKKRLPGFMKDDGSPVCVGSRRAPLDVWSGWPSARLRLNCEYDELSALPQSAGLEVLG